MLLDCHGVGGQGQGDVVEGGNQDWGKDDNRKLGFVWFLLSSTELEFPGSVQGGNKSRQIFPFTPKTPDSSVDCSGSGHMVDGEIWLSW